MKTVALAWQYLWARPLAAVLNLLLLSLGLASITLVLLVSRQVESAFERDLAAIDVVVGAKGSPLQLILAGVFHIDVPPGNIPLAEVRKLEANPAVAQLIPLSLGDSFQGFRIVGTTPAYPQHYGAALAAGRLWAAPMQAVLGAQVAKTTGLAVGAQFAGAHGMGGGGSAHADAPYMVAGVLQPCACVLDRLVLTALESVWELHEKAHGPPSAVGTPSAPGAAAHADHADHDEDERREVTVALIRYKSPLAAVSFPRYVNASTPMQAAAPALEITRLLRLLGTGTAVLRGFGAVLVLVAALSVFIALWNAVRERRDDLGLLRLLGAPPRRLAALLLCEALWLALAASVLGLLGGHGLTALLGYWLGSEQTVPFTALTWVADEWAAPAVAVAVALLAAALPAWAACRVDVAHLLNRR